MIESQQLDELTLDEAKAILCQIGYFAEYTYFMSLRLTASQLDMIQFAAAVTPLTVEELLSELCHKLCNPKQQQS